ncbi:MAG: 50S ribosomal protein L4 [Candidatus ainarchaeum sp.]|nr:50S ribosomal protein L4 [Candidatus ainarchaeum sp.]
MKANVYDLDGKVVKEIELPSEIFNEEYRPDLIKKAVISQQSNSYQKKGISPYSNRNNTAEYIGIRKANHANISINTGHARLPRLRNRRVLMAGRVMGVSQAVGGPRAHPPKVTKILVKKINTKERTKAILSAISATTDPKLVSTRGHILDTKITLPVIFDNKIEALNKTKDVLTTLERMGLDKDILKAKDKKSVRAGKGKYRGRRYKKRKSLLIVLADSKNNKAFTNLEGVNVISARKLSIKDLAPGTHAGRLTVFSEGAISELKKRFE